MRRRSTRLLVIAAGIAALLGCTEKPSDGAASNVARWEGPLPISAPWLRERLPPGVVAYVRVPHLLGLVAMPKGGMLDGALSSDANIRNLVEIDRGLTENLLGAHPLLSDPRLALLFGEVRSPIEIALTAMPTPGVLIGATVEAESAAALEASLAALAAGQPPVALAAPLDAEGFGELQGLPLPAFVSFDASTRRLLISAGPGVTLEGLKAAAGTTPPAEPHPMHALEERIDDSGQGLFAWVDVATLMTFAPAFAPPDAMAIAAQTGLGAVRAAALGTGKADGKGRISLLLDVGTDDPRRPYLVSANSLSLTTVGAPDAAFLLSLPSAAELARLEALLLGEASDPRASEWPDVKDRLRELIGVGLEELLAAVGPELVVIADGAGDYVALRVRDAALFDDVVRRISEAVAEPIVERDVAGRTFYQWRQPSLFARAAAGDALAGDGAAASAIELLGRLRERWYWVRDGEFVYLSNVPQPLVDRVRLGATTSLGDWLEETQGVDWSSSLLAGTGSVRKLPRRTYAVYLQMMQNLADLADVPYDIWSMPSATELGLPDAGAIGASLNLGEPYVSIELTYEAQPGELFLGAGGFASVAAVGMLAAITIPAYQDYTARATVSAALASAAPVRLRVEEHYAVAGRFPSEEEAAALLSDAVYPAASITVEPDTGIITAVFAPGAIPGGGELWLLPEPNGSGGLSWSCAGTIATKHLPSSCR